MPKIRSRPQKWHRLSTDPVRDKCMMYLFVYLYCSPALVCHITHTWWVWSCFISFRLWKREFSTAKQFGQWRSFTSNGETCGIRGICMSTMRRYQWSLHCSWKKRNRIVLECLHFHSGYFVSMKLICKFGTKLVLSYCL